MSSYLQRLASSVMQPAERIHPLVGSMFARPENLPNRRHPEDGLEVTDSAALRGLAVSEFSQNQQDASPEIQDMAASELPGRDFQQSPHLRSRLKQSLPPGDTSTSPTAQTLRSASFSSRDAFAFRPLFPPTSGRPLRTPAQEGTTRTAPPVGGEGTDEHAYTAVMPPKSVVAAGLGQPEVGGNLGGRAIQSARNQRMFPAMREPDQIEIHIGRIEVVAVPQVAPVPASRVSRKAESLTDYLARRDKRRP